MKSRFLIFYFVSLTMLSCSQDPKFEGTGDARQAHSSDQNSGYIPTPPLPLPQNSQQTPHNYKKPLLPPPPMPIIPYQPYTPTPIPSVPGTPTPTPPPVQPQGSVDGQEIFKTCSSCISRAQYLSPNLGFTASKSSAINLGFYKIDPAENLCDIHFLKNLNTPIDDHSGVDTIGNNQIILYCPCDCGWVSENNLPNFNQNSYPEYW